MSILTVVVVAVALAGTQRLARGAGAALVPSRLPVASIVTDGDVAALAVSGGTVYAAGFIANAGRRTGGFVLVDATSGRLRRRLPPALGGRVNAAISDGQGGWVVAGDFTTVGGRPCAGLARLGGSGRLDARFCHRIEGHVDALARSASTLLLGGDFRAFDGQPRLRLAALDLRTGRLVSWHPAVTGRVYNDRGSLTYPFVSSLAVVGKHLLVGGFFERIDNAERVGLAAFDARTLARLPWRADVAPASPTGVGITASSGRVFVWGFFSRLAGAPAAGVGALSASSGARLPWNVRVDGSVYGVAATSGRVFLAGAFSRVDGIRRPGVAAVDARTGRLKTSFRAAGVSDSAGSGSSYGKVDSLALADGRLYLGGEFMKIGTASRMNVAAVDAQTGRLLPWAPEANAGVATLTVLGHTVAVGGLLSSIDGARRFGLLAVDGADGRILPWRPRFDGDGPSALAVANGRLYVGGSFSHVDGMPRAGLAAFDLASGRLTSWAPTLKPSTRYFEVQRIAADRGTVYVAGDFARANGVPRRRLAAFDATTGAVLPWNPGLLGDGTDGYAEVKALQAVAGRVYLAGDFVRVDGKPQHGFAELDATTGALTPWQPRFDGLDGIESVYRSDNTVYVGGDFRHIEGARRSGLAALDEHTHALLPWAPSLARGWVSAKAEAISQVGTAVAVTGDFRSIGGRPHAAIALVDSVTGAVLPWAPPPSETAQFEANAAVASDSLLAFDGYVGGNADSVNVYRLLPR